MIDIDMKNRLRDAFCCSFAECDSNRDHALVLNCMVEVLTAINLSQDDVRYITSKADGMYAELDDVIDNLIDAFGV